jgi:predicted metal-dependent HD superfamily phosphohydrolase
MTLSTKWAETCQKLGIRKRENAFQHLLSCYREPHRHYHNLDHIAMGLIALKKFPNPLPERAIIALAYWFHDAVYDPTGFDNEEQSAALAASFVPHELHKRVVQLILATKLDHTPSTRSEQIICDIDLAIFGQDWQTYLAYECAIRKEYAFVPEVGFCLRRKHILVQFLHKPRIYQTNHAHVQFEKQARENLLRAVDLLSSYPAI